MSYEITKYQVICAIQVVMKCHTTFSIAQTALSNLVLSGLREKGAVVNNDTKKAFLRMFEGYLAEQIEKGLYRVQNGRVDRYLRQGL